MNQHNRGVLEAILAINGIQSTLAAISDILRERRDRIAETKDEAELLDPTLRDRREAYNSIADGIGLLLHTHGPVL